MKTFTDQIGVRFYAIRNKAGDYWSNTLGWVNPKPFHYSDSHVSVFTESEKADFTLPVGEGAYWEIF